MDVQYAVGTGDRPSNTIEELEAGERFSDVIDEVSESSQLRPPRFLSNLESLIQRHPWPTLLVGIGLGYLVARRAR